MHYQLAIIGGGVVGAGLAVALHDFAGKIALIDARLPTQNDPRLFALNASSCEFLHNIGIWPALSDDAAAIRQVHISKQGKFGAVRLTCEEVAMPALGHVVPAFKVEMALNAALAEQQNVDVFQPALLEAMSMEKDHVELKLSSEQGEVSLTVDRVVGADGTQSKVRELLKIPTTQFNYEQSAIVTRTQIGRPHRQVAYERFTKDGAVAMLPLTGLECATIWTAKTEKVTELMSLSETAFLAELQHVFGYRLGRLQGVSQRHTFPLRMLQSSSPNSDRVKLLGNSLHTLHPIAAQGFNLALYEVADLVASGWLQGEPIVHSNASKQSAFTTRFSHALAKLFKTEQFPSALLQMGMIGLDLARPAKRYLLNQLLGRVAGMPHLLQNKQVL